MAEHHVPKVIERTIDELEEMGLSPSILERFVNWWKRHGLRKAVVLVIAVTLPLWRYVWIPSTVSSGVSTIAESFGAELDVKDWTSDWGNIRVTGEDVVLYARGAYSNQQLLEASAVELDWSLWRGAGNLYERVKSLILFRDPPPEEPIHAVRLKRATLHLERLLSGRWNWLDAVAAERVNWEDTRRFRIPALDAEQLRLVWLEHLPASSGGGFIEQKTASLYLEDVRLRFTDLMLPEDSRPTGMRFAIDGRTADGVFSATGDMNLARWNTPSNGYRNASAAPNAWAPTFTVSMYLENVGAAAIGRLTYDASLMPSAGTMTGRIKFAVNAEGALECDVDVQMRNVEYAPNPRSNYIQARRQEVEQGLKGFTINDHIRRVCKADWQEPDFRLAKALQAEITGEAVKDAPAVVQGAAGYDRLRFVDVQNVAINTFTDEMTAKIGAAIGGARGEEVARALTAKTDQNGGNPVTRGVRSVGRGIKRLFGGGDKKK
jgi:hypothetical protein